jgi:hypothetical protein
VAQQPYYKKHYLNEICIIFQHIVPHIPSQPYSNLQ